MRLSLLAVLFAPLVLSACDSMVSVPVWLGAEALGAASLAAKKHENPNAAPAWPRAPDGQVTTTSVRP